ncbi:hypothetical protein [Streptomyces sp. NPDC047070]|uniref:hypothetical protein n=1 Tax=Streptomyces sp. NPDC047070 TaxID=3154923 RepID=UPI003452FA8A
MYVDLRKDELPPEPEPEGEPQPKVVPAAVKKEPVRLTARQEIMIPLRELWARVLAGSPVLAVVIMCGLWGVLRNVAGMPAPPPEKAPAKAAKADSAEEEGEGDEDDGEEDDEEEGEDEAKPKKKAKQKKSEPKKKAAGPSFPERVALGAFSVAMMFAFLGAVGPVLAHALAPYMGWVVLAGIVSWCLAAAHYAPAKKKEDTPENDHEKEAGEQPEETVSVGDLDQQKAAIWTFVEGAVAAGAAGHRVEKGRGATVDSLLAEMQERRPLPGWDRKRMVALLGQVGIPFRDQMSFTVTEEVNGKTEKTKLNVNGVHVDDMAKELGRTPVLPPQFVPEITPGQTPDSTPDSSLNSPADLALIGALLEGPQESPLGRPVDPPDEVRSGAA